jgi:ribonuclease D
MPTPAPSIVLLDRQADLDAACAGMDDRTELPLDTEFARTNTYRPKLCLLQLAAGDTAWCVDTLAGLDMAALWARIADPAALKVLHAAKQDLEVFLLQFGALPGPLFDTQIAAGLLGHPPQVGYAALLEAELGVRIDKTQTRTDWSRRPLTAAQIEYAGNDVLHLPALTARLRERLAAAGRSDWALADSAALLDPALYAVRAESAWERLGGIEYQTPVVQARARRLAAWRELRADQSDRPRQWILADDALQRLAATGPTDTAAVEALGILPPALLRNSGAALLAALRAGEADHDSGAVAPIQRSRQAAPDNGKLKALGALVQQVAGALGIAAEVLATRQDLVGIARGDPAARPLHGWRRAVIGEQLLAAL